MTILKLHNTKTRKREEFVPIDPQNVRMYVCGPTVYDRAHLGNARPVIVFDVLNRLLRHVYGQDHVTYVRNFTDIDDKINARAARDNKDIGEITAETTQWFLDDMAAVGALEPDHMPRATAFVPQMIAMIEELIANGHAYEAEGHALFAVDSYKEYGALSGRSVDDMIAGARVEIAPYKRNPMDFVLWKPSDAATPGWDSPWGRGRPGWHIECSAMAHELLGSHFDIHGGGNDLMFPHHENEIAQSCCVGDEFANVWLHNEMLQVEGKKMSKSLGNFFTVRDLLDQGVSGEVIRFVMLSTHYRKPMDWTEKKREEAEKTLRKWYALADTVEDGATDDQLVGLLADDLNTAGAITHMHKLAGAGDAASLRGALQLVGLLDGGVPAWERQNEIEGDTREEIHRRLDRLIAMWKHAKSINDFSKSDDIRAFLQISGFVIDLKGGEASWRQSNEGEAFGWSTLTKSVVDGRNSFSKDDLVEFAKLRGFELQFDGGTLGPPLKGSISGSLVLTIVKRADEVFAADVT